MCLYTCRTFTADDTVPQTARIAHVALRLVFQMPACLKVGEESLRQTERQSASESMAQSIVSTSRQKAVAQALTSSMFVCDTQKSGAHLPSGISLFGCCVFCIYWRRYAGPPHPMILSGMKQGNAGNRQERLADVTRAGVLPPSQKA